MIVEKRGKINSYIYIYIKKLKIMAEKKKSAKKAPAKKTAKKTSTKKKATTKKATKKVTKKAAPKKPVAKKPVAKKVEIIRDVATKPLNVIQPDIKPEIVNEIKGDDKCDAPKTCACRPHWFWRLLAFNFIFQWDWCKDKK